MSNFISVVFEKILQKRCSCKQHIMGWSQHCCRKQVKRPWSCVLISEENFPIRTWLCPEQSPYLVCSPKARCASITQKPLSTQKPVFPSLEIICMLDSLTQIASHGGIYLCEAFVGNESPRGKESVILLSFQ